MPLGGREIPERVGVQLVQGLVVTQCLLTVCARYLASLPGVTPPIPGGDPTRGWAERAHALRDWCVRLGRWSALHVLLRVWCRAGRAS